MSVEIYHNPRCSKSRQTLEILEQNGIAPKITRYLDTPPDRETLESILKMLNMEPRELMRKGESEYTNNSLDNPALTREELIQAMLDHPILIERPVVITNGKAAIGRPPASVLEIV